MDGTTLSVLESGAGDPIVLLHGIPTGAELWRDVAGSLAAAGWHALAPDLPGYGATRLPAQGDHSLAGSATLIAAWLVGQELAPAWVVGHDAGGGIAQILAVRRPDVVSRLTLVNSIADGSWPAPRARFATAVARAGGYRPAAWLRLVPNAYLRWQIRRSFADAARAKAVVDGARGAAVLWDGKYTDPGGRDAFQRHLAALSAQDTAAVLAGLQQLAMPVQVVWGTADPFQRWAVAGRRLTGLLPGAAVDLLHGCGHLVPLECPDRLVEALLGWRARTG